MRLVQHHVQQHPAQKPLDHGQHAAGGHRRDQVAQGETCQRAHHHQPQRTRGHEHTVRAEEQHPDRQPHRDTVHHHADGQHQPGSCLLVLAAPRGQRHAVQHGVDQHAHQREQQGGGVNAVRGAMKPALRQPWPQGSEQRGHRRRPASCLHRRGDDVEQHEPTDGHQHEPVQGGQHGGVPPSQAMKQRRQGQGGEACAEEKVRAGGDIVRHGVSDNLSGLGHGGNTLC